MQALNLSDDHPVTVQAILKNSLATSDYNKANCLNNQFYNNFNHSYPHYQLLFLSKVTLDCPNVLLCTEHEAFELILGLGCTKSTGSQPGC